MKHVVLSYSRTGNNNALAERIATRLDARHVRITEARKRSMGRIALDVIFNREPKTRATADVLVRDDEVPVFVAPVWMGKVASPMRRTFSQVRGTIHEYGFVSISGGADGPDSNSGLEGDLEARLGVKPTSLVDLHIADLLPKEPAPTRDDTMHYSLSDEDVDALAEEVVATLE